MQAGPGTGPGVLCGWGVHAGGAACLAAHATRSLRCSGRSAAATGSPSSPASKLAMLHHTLQG